MPILPDPTRQLRRDKQTVDERVRQLQKLRGISLSKEERQSASAFLAGREIPEAMANGSMEWQVNELLTVLRWQGPRWDDLVAELGNSP